MRHHLIWLSICIMLISGILSAEEARLLRFPDVHKDKIAFVYAGDLYIAPRDGGRATQITRHEGLELFPRFSPDGTAIAFTGQYDGDQSVYIMPVGGGDPQRLTYHPAIQRTSERMGPDNIVMGWHPDGTSVLFRSRKEAPDSWFGRAYLVSVDGGLPEQLPMHKAGFTSFSPDAKKVAYCPIFRDFRMWKRYMGGMAQDVWTFDLESFESRKITDWEGTDNLPMWYGDKIYFNSDRTGTLNIFCYDINTGETRQVTAFTEFDVRWPSLGPDAIAFENGGFVYVLDLPSEEMHKVTVEMISDNLNTRTEFISVSDRVYDFDVSPDGKRAVFSARGEVFTVPAKEGNTRNLTNSSGAHDKEPTWSPDGKWIAYFSDETGEDEIFLVSQDGSEKVRLTTDGHCWRRGILWSPDSKKIAFADKNNKFYYVDVEGKNIVTIDESRHGGFYDYSWSPDSRYITYTRRLPSDIAALFIYDLEGRKIHQVTPGYSHSFSPKFDPDGKYLYFLSERSFNPMFDTYQFEFVNNAITDLYLILLSAEDESPFAPESDEVAVTEEDDDDDDGDEDHEAKDEDEDEHKGKDNDKDEDNGIEVKIDFDGIYDRQIAFDISAGNIGGLSAISGAVFYTKRPLSGMRGRIGEGKTVLHKYVLEDKEDNEFASGVGAYILSADSKKMIVSRNGGYHIIGTGGGKASFEDSKLNLSRMEMKLDRRAENVQMFHEAWRRNRDFFYDENMHGVDWEKMRGRYEVLLPYVAHRFDLTYVISEMVSELACSHTYVGGGDMPKIPSSQVGLLGCDFEIDDKNNRIRISRILTGENWNDDLRSPLMEPKIDINEGDYLLAIDGQEVTADVNPYALTDNKADRLITLTVNDKPSMDDAREVTVKPIGSETSLRYHDWVESRRAYVDSASNEQIGYIHIPDMGGYGLTRFTKMFYYQMRKPALIIDVRANGGGFVSQLVIKRLREELSGVSVSRNSDPRPRPGDAVNAHMLTLINEFSVSDGDIFPHYFRHYGLGPLMGKRTWGGIVGIGGGRRLVDGGYNYIPGGTQYNLDSEWIIENVGVEPDIEVDNPPNREAEGYDDQLMEAVKYLQIKLKADPRKLPAHPGPPKER
jgi:tricorn protease